MRFVANASNGRKRLHVTIEADSAAQAQVGAERWARHHRVGHLAVQPDFAAIKVIDGEVLVQESVFDDDYVPFPES